MKHSCDLCGTNEQIPLPGDPSGKIGICSECGFIYVSERRSLEEIAKAWSEIYASGAYSPDWAGVRARLWYTAEWLDQNIGLSGKSALDIGAGNGLFMSYCRDRGALACGIDPDRENVRKIEAQKMGCMQAYVDDALTPQVGFDLVTLNWTLENCGDALAVLRYAKRCLAPGGHVVVATGSRIGVPFKKRLCRYLPQDPNYPHDTHCFRWSARSLARAFRAVGLTPTSGGDNDYTDRDELILAAKERIISVPDWTENPLEVANHFRRWQEQFP